MPFARRHWVEKPKRPGRKAGQGNFAHRELPKVVKLLETKEAKLPGCPDCGEHLQAIRKHEQFVTDIPVVEVKTTHFVTYSGYCTSCHKRVRSQHRADLASHRSGGGGTAPGMAADLKPPGVSYGKVSEVFNDAFGLSSAAVAGAGRPETVAALDPSMKNCGKPYANAVW
jgi:ribosomal protein L34E